MVVIFPDHSHLFFMIINFVNYSILSRLQMEWLLSDYPTFCESICNMEESLTYLFTVGIKRQKKGRVSDSKILNVVAKMLRINIS